MFNPILMPLYNEVSNLNYTYGLSVKENTYAEFVLITKCNDKTLQDFQQDLLHESKKIEKKIGKKVKKESILREIREILLQIHKGYENKTLINVDESIAGLPNFDEAADVFDIVDSKYSQKDYQDVIIQLFESMISNIESIPNTGIEDNEVLSKISWTGTNQQLFVLLEVLNKTGWIQLPQFSNGTLNQSQIIKLVLETIDFTNRSKQPSEKALANAYADIKSSGLSNDKIKDVLNPFIEELV